MSIVRDSKKIKEVLLTRLCEIYPSSKGQGYVGSKVIKDASERNFKITAGCLSGYFASKTTKSILSEEQIIWLCIRYGIPVQFTIGVNTIVDNRIVTEIPKFNEVNALKMLKQIFG